MGSLHHDKVKQSDGHPWQPYHLTPARSRHLTSNMSTASGPSMAQERSAQHMGSTANASVRASHQGGAGSTLEGARSTGSAWGLPSGGHTLTGAGQSMFGSALSVLPGAIHSTAGTTGD
jgi:hypothetical protein